MERDFFEGMSEEERVESAPLIMEWGAIIDVAEGRGDVMGVLDAETLGYVERYGRTEEGKRTISFFKTILGVDRPGSQTEE